MTKYDNAPGSALVSHAYVNRANRCICLGLGYLIDIYSTDEGFMGSQSLVEFMKDPKGYASPFSMTIQQHLNMFDWYEQAGNKWRAHRFATAMNAVASVVGQGGFASGKC